MKAKKTFLVASRRTFDVQVSIYLEDILGKTEGMFQIFRRFMIENLVVVEEIRSELVDQGVEGQTVLPAAGEVSDLHTLVSEEKGVFKGRVRCSSNPLLCC